MRSCSTSADALAGATRMMAMASTIHPKGSGVTAMAMPLARTALLLFRGRASALQPCAHALGYALQRLGEVVPVTALTFAIVGSLAPVRVKASTLMLRVDGSWAS